MSASSRLYAVTEMFCSPQGEGARAGELSVFVRFAGCNMQCSVDGKEGFNCDTDFRYVGFRLKAAELAHLARQESKTARHVIFTGGEPTLQLTEELLAEFRAVGFRLCLETNGTRGCDWNGGEWLGPIDWVSCSPKPGSNVVITTASEVRVVVSEQHPEPDDHGIRAAYYFVSPAFIAATAADQDAWREARGYAHPELNQPKRAAVAAALAAVRKDPRWRISTQQHKAWGVR